VPVSLQRHGSYRTVPSVQQSHGSVDIWRRSGNGFLRFWTIVSLLHPHVRSLIHFDPRTGGCTLTRSLRNSQCRRCLPTGSDDADDQLNPLWQPHWDSKDPSKIPFDGTAGLKRGWVMSKKFGGGHATLLICFCSNSYCMQCDTSAL
jgi:hypothetical protein